MVKKTSVIRKPGGRPSPANPARRHFVGILAAGTARTVAISSALVAGLKVNKADALGIFPRGYPGGGRTPNCFRRGTLIRTAHGEVPVEDLATGDLVVTTNGELPVKWIGQQTIRRATSGSYHPSVVPIRVSRFAIDDQTPRRDLYLSQEHCLFIDGVLIPAKYLVNGLSIALDRDANLSETIEYFSVEFETHEVVFAEGAAAESFQYAGGRIAWDNLSEYQDLYGSEHEVMSAFAPICRYSGGRAEVRGLLRLAASRFVDVRDPIQIAYDRIAARAMAIAA
jgi:Hint domain